MVGKIRPPVGRANLHYLCVLVPYFTVALAPSEVKVIQGW